MAQNVELSLEEKIRLTSGDGAWRTWDADGKLPSIMMCDGPHGLRKQKIDETGKNNDSVPATCFPTESAVACSWNPEAVAKMASAIAEEALAEKVSIVLGCGVNIKRSPLCGRNFEYFSEDPFLAGTLATAYIKAMESRGVGTSLKHFAGNNQEMKRMTMNSQIDERALHEIYLTAFEMAVKEAKPKTVMASYNQLNGKYSCENEHLLTEILRKEWGYEGTVISDWGACVDPAKCIHAGMDLEMPDSRGLHTGRIRKGLENGTVTESDINRAVANVRKLYESPSYEKVKVDFEKHHQLAVEIEQESAVLLKNEGFFPVDFGRNVYVVGALAKQTRYQGGGSSHINATRVDSVVDALAKRKCKVTYLPGYRVNTDIPDYHMEAETLRVLRRAKKENAAVLFFCGLTEQYEGEGYDRKKFAMPKNQLLLLEKMLAKELNIGVVTFGGAPFEMLFAGQVPAILHMYLGGQGVGEACARLLVGEVNPSGKLAETFPFLVQDLPGYEQYGDGHMDVQYRESIFVGYRYYETYGRTPLFPFGHGLSYTSFEYSDLQLSTTEYKGGELVATCKVTNTGECSGSEIVQFYVENPKSNYLRATKELRGFQKVALKPGETKEVRVSLNERSFSIYDEKKKQFLMPSGIYQVLAAASSVDTRLRSEVQVFGETYDRDDRKLLAEYFNQQGQFSISQEQFQTLYGRPFSHLDEKRVGEFSVYDSLDSLAAHSFLGKVVLFAAQRMIYSMFPGRSHKDPEVKMMLQGLHEGTIDSVLCQSDGAVPYKVAEAIVLSANGHHIQSIRKLLEKESNS